CACSGVRPVREPDAGKPHVRFDEEGRETRDGPLGEWTPDPKGRKRWGSAGPAHDRARSSLYVRRVKGPCLLQVQVLPGKLSGHPGSYRGGEEGNRIAEALGTRAHHGWVSESTGRNASEARAGLERDVVSADLPFEQGRPLDLAGVTDQ